MREAQLETLIEREQHAAAYESVLFFAFCFGLCLLKGKHHYAFIKKAAGRFSQSNNEGLSIPRKDPSF